jgi:hypothetical protein
MRARRQPAMIVKTSFLAKIIHRILIQNIHDKKSLHENVSQYADDLRIAGILSGEIPLFYEISEMS